MNDVALEAAAQAARETWSHDPRTGVALTPWADVGESVRIAYRELAEATVEAWLDAAASREVHES